MAFDIAATAQAIQTLIKGAATPKFFSVEIARPGQPVGEGPSVTIHGESMRVVQVTLSQAVEVHVLKVRIWRAMNTNGEQARELEAMALTSQLLDLLYSDIDLGARIRNIDVAGEHSGGLEAQFTDENIENGAYHIADITLPLIVDSATAMAA